jgi:hypothetical protein
LAECPDRNVLINHAHPDTATIKLAASVPFSFDPRLICQSVNGAISLPSLNSWLASSSLSRMTPRPLMAASMAIMDRSNHNS